MKRKRFWADSRWGKGREAFRRRRDALRGWLDASRRFRLGAWPAAVAACLAIIWAAFRDTQRG